MEHPPQTKKKVLYVITKSNWGGAQKYVFELATKMPSERYSVVVALGGTGGKGDEPGMLQKRLEVAGIATKVVPHFMRDMSLTDDIRAFFELWHIVRKEKPDVLHATSSKAGGIGAILGRFARVPSIVFTSHGLTFDESWRPSWQRALIYVFTWLTMLLSTRTIQISTDTYERARKMPFIRNKVALVHNGIDAPDFLARLDARKALLPDHPDTIHTAMWIGTIAEYHPNKNLRTLIEALALCSDTHPALQLILIGEEGEERDVLQALAKKLNVDTHVHLLGTVPHAARYFKALDIFTLPSKKEGLPYVLLEAGLAELPCVVSNITGTKEIVTHEKTGLVVDATAGNLANACKTLLHDPSIAEKYAKALHEDVQRRFSVERMVARTIRTYQ